MVKNADISETMRRSAKISPNFVFIENSVFSGGAESRKKRYF